MRKYWSLIVLVALVAVALAGCSAPTEKSATPAVEKSETAEEAPAGDTGSTVGDSGPAALEPETDGERAAFALADATEGRMWASGDWQNGTPVEGEAALVGYWICVTDGATQYQVRVFDGQVVPVFGNSGDTVLPSSYQTFIAPATDRQRAAFDAAVAEVTKTNPNATQGGIDLYIFFFPPDASGTYHQVSIYADTATGTYGMGGTEVY